MSTDCAGWRARATPLDAPFEPTRDALAFVVLQSSMITPSGFTLALCAPDIAIDAHGRVLRLAAADYAGLVALAHSILALPRPFQWRVTSSVSCRAINEIVLPGPTEDVTHSVYNWNTGTRELERKIEDRTELPDEIQTLLALAHETVGDERPPRAVPDIGRRIRALIHC